MGLFDGFDAGWNSFKNNELKTITNVAFAPNPIVKAISNPKKAIEEPSSLLPSAILGNNGPVKQTGGGDGYIPADEWEKVAEDAKNTLLAPNPIISLVTGNTEDAIPGGKTAAEKWENVTETVNEEVVQPVNETVVQPIIKETEKITETVKETVTNVTKGVTDALPIIAIGGAAVLVVSLLLGRR